MKISAIVSDHSLFLSRLLYVRLYINNELKEVMNSFSTFHWDTMNVPSYWFPSENIEFPLKIDISYTSLTDGKTFEGGINVDCYANIDKIKEMANDGSAFLNIGLCANGVVAIWVQAINKSILVAYHSIEEVPAERGAVNSNKFQDKAMLPERNYFDKLMQQFCYRYLVLAERWDGERWLPLGEKDAVPEIDWVEEVLWDGTHDKLHDGSLMRYHAAGKPRKLAVKFHVGKDEYSAYFWMDEVRTREIFDRFYGAHRDTKCDFIIHIDPESRRYELALFRYGLQEPQVLPADAFEVLVFKNRFEHYRSDNYSQPRGAWIW